MDCEEEIYEESVKIVLNALKRGGPIHLATVVADLLRRNQRLQNESFILKGRKSVYDNYLHAPYIKMSPNVGCVNLSGNLQKECTNKDLNSNLVLNVKPEAGAPHPLEGCCCTACINLIQITNIHIYKLETRHKQVIAPNNAVVIQEEGEKHCTILYLGHQRTYEGTVALQMANKLRPFGAVVLLWESNKEIFITLNKILYMLEIEPVCASKKPEVNDNAYNWGNSTKSINYSAGYNIGRNIINRELYDAGSNKYKHSCSSCSNSLNVPEIPKCDSCNNNNEQDEQLRCLRSSSDFRYSASTPQLRYQRDCYKHGFDRNASYNQFGVPRRNTSLPVENLTTLNLPHNCSNYGLTGRRLSDTLDSAVGLSLDGSSSSFFDCKELHGSKNRHINGGFYSTSPRDNVRWLNCSSNFFLSDEMLGHPYFQSSAH